MKRWWCGTLVAAMVVAAATASAADPPQNCATSFVIDASGVLDENTVAPVKCQAGGAVVAAVCNYDAHEHMVQMIAKMIYRGNGKSHQILKANVHATVAAATGATPTCVAVPQHIFDPGDFGAGKKPYGLYSYIILTDGSVAADPDLDVAPPNSVDTPAQRRGGRGGPRR